ncbi:MAG TPA: IS66 family insertion sequence element accessory protein TnpB, partial [Polyangiales bacterium]|nr:IS66 family insertion sequence element accessory protein TnpB [Polyangiales bacterium]
TAFSTSWRRPMLSFPSSIRIFVATAPCDMRRQFDGLASLVRVGMGRDPKSGDLYIFRNKRGDLIKALFFDQHGYCMLAKRLERGRFRMMLDDTEADAEITTTELAQLLTELTLRCGPSSVVA